MFLFFHEMRRNRLSLIIWTSVLSFMLAVCVLIYPEMKSQMADMSEMFANMGDFSEAFGMDELQVGEFMGYFGVECSEVLGLGGALFAAILGATILSKEEKDKTAEFLLTHPINRVKVTLYKLFALIAQIIILNICVLVITLISVAAVGEDADIKVMLLLFFSYFTLQSVVGCIAFGLSAFVRRGSIGVGLGIGLLTYFLNILANLTESLDFIKYITPFAFADGGHIVNNCALEWKYIIPGAVVAVTVLVFGIKKYDRKDIA